MTEMLVSVRHFEEAPHPKGLCASPLTYPQMSPKYGSFWRFLRSTSPSLKIGPVVGRGANPQVGATVRTTVEMAVFTFPELKPGSSAGARASAPYSTPQPARIDNLKERIVAIWRTFRGHRISTMSTDSSEDHGQTAGGNEGKCRTGEGARRKAHLIHRTYYWKHRILAELSNPTTQVTLGLPASTTPTLHRQAAQQQAVSNRAWRWSRS